MKKIFIALVVIICLAVIGLGVISYLDGRKESDVNFTVRDTLPEGEGKKATVILLGGQSNAAGCSRDEYLKANVTEEKYKEYERGYDNVYINYFVTANNESQGFVNCANMQGEPNGYFGPELGLAEKLSAAYPDRTFFIIKYTWSGSNLREQWLSPSGRGKTGDLYRQFVKYVNTSLEYLESKNYDISIEAMCWMQGESDSSTEYFAKNYEAHLKNFIKDIREEFKGYASDDGITFVDAYISDSILWPHYKLINQSKQAVADSSDINVVIDTISAGLTVTEEPIEAPDLAHYDSLSEIKLGHMYAEEIAKFLD